MEGGRKRERDNALSAVSAVYSMPGVRTATCMMTVQVSFPADVTGRQHFMN